MVALLLQHLTHQHADVLVVIDDEDVGRVVLRHSRQSLLPAELSSAHAAGHVYPPCASALCVWLVRKTGACALSRTSTPPDCAPHLSRCSVPWGRRHAECGALAATRWEVREASCLPQHL